MQVVFVPSSLCVWKKSTNRLEKSTNSSVTLRFFARSPSMIQLIVRICEVVERFLQKPL